VHVPAVGEITVGLPGGVSVSVGPGSSAAGSSILEDRLAEANATTTRSSGLVHTVVWATPAACARNAS
jgi:hypothetical protein